ncbi:MAG: hypothetical protein JWM47_4011 [Acidimicrobiales bacterium]|nr:hypothetical protein [Acidimicrobiales bacterium]
MSGGPATAEPETCGATREQFRATLPMTNEMDDVNKEHLTWR